MERLEPKLGFGLSDKQVNSQLKKGLINKDTTVPTKKISAIVVGNIFTLFNLLNFFFAFLIFMVG